MRLTINTETDTYEQAIAAVQAAYGLRSVTPDDWPEAPAVDPRPGPQDLDDDIGNGWSEQALFRMIASLIPGARAVLRRINDLAAPPRSAKYSSTSPTIRPPRSRKRRSAEPSPASRRYNTASARLLQRNERARLYHIGPALVEGLRRTFAIADARPDLLRGEPARGPKLSSRWSTSRICSG
ncbi:hypothetical protein [Streptomyces violaceusniger]|uniref:Uncharacterized protein n=1 Tax=Streptomyces violaceusniger TaxID=68280 RepID=A0A4D4LFV0_STRVO|nr:hypothetical protein SVIO_111440 [Streptomyces violaceusniger]